jgi:hypothetical protein
MLRDMDEPQQSGHNNNRMDEPRVTGIVQKGEKKKMKEYNKREKANKQTNKPCVVAHKQTLRGSPIE